MFEAILYKVLENNAVECRVCSHFCKIEEGKRGICGVRENMLGKLYALNYGYTIAAAIDPIEKKPLYHFLPSTKTYSLATVGCNLRCAWCQNHDISQSPKPNQEIQGTFHSPEEHVDRALRYGCPSISYTYSEPTIFLEYALDIMKLAKKKHLKNIWVTNGYMSKETLELILPYLDAANVDYKGPSDEMYMKYCGAKATPIIENLVRLKEAGIHIEITTLLVPDINDSETQIRLIAKTIIEHLGKDIPWHISRFFPAWKMSDIYPTSIFSMEKAKKIGLEEGIKTIHLGNI